MAIIIFLTGIISGSAWGIGYTDSVLHVTLAAIVGGFAGSAAAAACFTAMYLFSSKEEEGSESPVKERALSAPEENFARQLPGLSDAKLTKEEKRIKEIEGELNQLKKKRKKQIL